MRKSRQAKALKAVHTLDLLIEFFDGGKNWTQRSYENRGQRCLLGALNWICEAASRPKLNRKTAEFYLVRALPPVRPGVWLPLTRFNDTRKNYGELLQFLEKARTLAQADASPAQRRAKRPADRQRHSALIQGRSTSMCTTLLSHAELASTER